MIFELLAMICIDAVCQERLLPAPQAQTKIECEASAVRATSWAKARKGATAKSTRCASMGEIQAHAASVIEVAPGAFVHVGKIEDPAADNGGDSSNHGFIVGEKSVAVIDAGYSRKIGEALYIAIRQRTDKPISHLLLTHMHPDHTIGGDVFLEAGAKTIAAPKFQKAYDSRIAAYLEGQKRLIGTAAAHGSFGHLTVNETVSSTIDLGNRKLRLQTYPTAHTTNDMTITDISSQTIWVGDLAFVEHTPALDGSISGWIQLLNEWVKADIKNMVSGHGPALTNFPDGLHATRDYLTAIAAHTRSAIAKGVSLQSFLKDKGDAFRGSWKLFDNHHRRNVTNAFVELEWE